MFKQTLTAVIIGLIVSFPAKSETLKQALAATYKKNPTIAAARAQQKALDENVPQARALYKPTISGQLDAAWSESSSVSSGIWSTSTDDTYSGTLTINQNIYNGGATKATVAQAQANVKSGQYGLVNTTQNIMLQAVQIFMSVLRDNAVVHLRERNIEVLRKELQSTRDRFEVGEVTRTDVAQSEARLATAVAQLQAAIATAEGSKASYVQIVGHEPRGLKAPIGISKILPTSRASALQMSYVEHPAILAAKVAVEAAEQNIKIQEARIKPKVNFIGSGYKEYNTDGSTSDASSLSATVRASIPIYSGGANYSFIRQAKHQLQQQKLTRDASVAEVQAAVITAWNNLQSSREQIKAARSSVRAAEIAQNGIVEEVKVGQRTTLDLLNARQELLDSRVTLVTAERDAVISAYSLLSSIGKLSPDYVGLQVAKYNPDTNLERVNDKWFGLRVE